VVSASEFVGDFKERLVLVLCKYLSAASGCLDLRVEDESQDLVLRKPPS